MKVYLAGREWDSWGKHNFYDFYYLESFYYACFSKRTMNYSWYKDFIMDSGAFTLINDKNKSQKVDWEKYIDCYGKFIKHKKIKQYIEVDIDNIIGLQEVEKLRKKLEKRVGWDCMPVWHISRGYDKWLEMCKRYSYVCIAGFATNQIKESQYPAVIKMISDAKKYNCKVHGLGFTRMKWIHKIKFYSVDSSSWILGDKIGERFYFENGKMIRKPRDKKFRISNRKGIRWYNFLEWVKYQRYADKYL